MKKTFIIDAITKDEYIAELREFLLSHPKVQLNNTMFVPGCSPVNYWEPDPNWTPAAAKDADILATSVTKKRK